MDKITQSLQQRRNNGGCSMWREVGIPKMVELGNWSKLKDWEKEYFLVALVDTMLELFVYLCRFLHIRFWVLANVK